MVLFSSTLEQNTCSYICQICSAAMIVNNFNLYCPYRIYQRFYFSAPIFDFIVLFYNYSVINSNLQVLQRLLPLYTSVPEYFSHSFLFVSVSYPLFIQLSLRFPNNWVSAALPPYHYITVKWQTMKQLRMFSHTPHIIIVVKSLLVDFENFLREIYLWPKQFSRTQKLPTYLYNHKPATVFLCAHHHMWVLQTHILVHSCVKYQYTHFYLEFVVTQ